MPNTPREKADDREEKEGEGLYYYDDAHGYEEFDPDEEIEDGDEGADLAGGAFDVDLD